MNLPKHKVYKISLEKVCKNVSAEAFTKILCMFTKLKEHLRMLMYFLRDQVANLRRHMRTHSDERPFLCSQCGSSFKGVYNIFLKLVYFFHQQLANLQSHLRTHSSERPFLCPQCGYAFKGMSLFAHCKVTVYAAVYINQSLTLFKGN